MSSPAKTPQSVRRSSRRNESDSPATPRSERSTRSRRGTDQAGMMSPPAARRPRMETSPDRADNEPSSLFSSPAPPANSEIDASSPLHYGTPSSRVTGTPAGGVTPRRRRVDIVEPQSRVVDVNNEVPSSEVGSESGTGPHMVIWGTDIDVEACKNKFKRFLRHFRTDNIADDEHFDGLDVSLPLYMQKLDEINLLGEPFLNFSCEHLRSFDNELYNKLISYPQEVIPTCDIAVNDIFFEKFPNTVLDHTIQVRPYSAELTKNMRLLNPEDIDQLITISGMVIRSSNIIPEMREALFKCSVCQHVKTVEVDRGRIAEPVICENCQTNFSYTLIHNRSAFSDKQMIRLQEAPEDMAAGQTPHTAIIYAHNDLVDSVQPGDRVHVTGVYRATALRVNPRQRNVKSVYKTHIDVVHFRKTDAKRLRDNSDSEVPRLSDERIATIKSLPRDKPDLYERLAAALAPSIYEHEDIKKGILLQLFGGTRKDLTVAGRGHHRSDINLLLCGDPGTSKSQLLQYVYNLVPRGQYTSGKGSSAVGLTAYVTKDPETRQLVLQTGALVLSDNGVCCIDEFDKMSDTTRSVLHEVMEQQTLSIAKAGIICQLNARTSILAAANPVGSQWNKNKTIIENIQLPHTLLSRFDLIFLLLDPQDETYDRRLATHLVSLYYKSPTDQHQEHMDLGLLRDYIAYARAYIQPKLSEDASQALIHAYVDMRKIGSGRGHVSAYPRQLESLIRLSEAHAKMRLSQTVEVVDVEEARRLHREALKQAAVDPATGRIDVSILTTGVSGAARKRRVELAAAVKKLIQSKGKVLTLQYQKIFEELRQQSDLIVSRDVFDEALEELREQDYIIMTGRIIRPQHTD